MAAWNTTTGGIATVTAIFVMTATIATAVKSRFQNLHPGRQLEKTFF
jgi:hypothetical protein